jgi:flagellar motor switch protein FliG
MSKDETIDGAKIAALILSRMPSRDQERIMSSIQAANPTIAAKLEDSLFNFDRIAQLNDHAVQDLLKEIPHRDIVISLKAAGDQVKEKLLENMSESKQRLVQDDFSSLPPMRISDVQAAQRRILRKLEELYPENGIGAHQRSVLPRLA